MKRGPHIPVPLFKVSTPRRPTYLKKYLSTPQLGESFGAFIYMLTYLNPPTPEKMKYNNISFICNQIRALRTPNCDFIALQSSSKAQQLSFLTHDIQAAHTFSCGFSAHSFNANNTAFILSVVKVVHESEFENSNILSGVQGYTPTSRIFIF